MKAQCKDRALETADRHCRNCGAPLAGDYCARCGQHESRGDLHFAEAAGDIVGDIFTWDSRLWRTLVPLLVRPGFLSAEFNAGRRARYMPPFRLYLVISFLLFLVVSLTARDSIVLNGDAADDADTVIAIGGDIESLPESVRERVLQAREAARGQDAPSDNSPAPAGTEEAGQIDSKIDSEVESNLGESPGYFQLEMGENAPPWLKDIEARIERNAQGLSDDPSQFLDSLFEYLPQMMFLMLPIFALLLKFLYLFSPFHYLQHLVFGLHYHSFVYVLYLLSALFEAVGWQGGSVFALLLLVYLPLALRKAYGSSWFGAIGKSAVMCFSYALVLIVGFAAVAIMALAFM